MRNLRKIISLGKVFAGLKYPADKASGLSNPESRAEIPADFPETISPYSAEEALALIETQLAKRGTTLKEAGRITIAYPHKHAGLFPNHHNSAHERAAAFQAKMKKIAPGVEWVMADALSERVHLDRSGNQSSIHALTAKQTYDVYMAAQKEPLPFADKNRTAKEYFVIVDNTIEQGTTIANLMSYIAHNNAEVLMVQADRHTPFAQRRASNDNASKELSPKFNDVSRNSGRVFELAKVFSQSAKQQGLDWTPQESIEKFESALQKHGNSVFALTDGEVEQVVRTVNGSRLDGVNFPALLRKLEKSAPRVKSGKLQPAFA